MRGSKPRALTPKESEATAVTNPNPDKASLCESLGGQPARRAGAAIADPMVSRRNTADGCPAARPRGRGAPQMARLGVSLLAKGTAIACGARLDPDHLWGSEPRRSS